MFFRVIIVRGRNALRWRKATGNEETRRKAKTATAKGWMCCLFRLSPFTLAGVPAVRQRHGGEYGQSYR